MASSSGGTGTGAPPACTPCSTMDPSFLLTKEQVTKELEESLPLWELQSDDTTPVFLSRTFVAKNFQCALDALNAMGTVAERESHHPDFHLTNYRQLRVVIYTHKLNGITDSDVVLARKMDEEVKVEYSPKWLKEHPEAKSTSKV